HTVGVGRSPSTVFTPCALRYALCVLRHALCALGYGRNTMIHSQSTFTQRLKEERNRSDRNGRPFSFLLLKVHNIPSRRRAFAVQTLDSFSKTIRMSDCLGWLSEYQLGLILPDTDEKGALVVHERLNRYLTGLKKCDLNRIASDNGAILVMEYPKSLEETVLADSGGFEEHDR
ncbi:MAG: hypothetical protein P8X90_36400, partial [Desulfobacterales bacterium]